MLKLICTVDGNPDSPKITDRKPRQVGDQRIFDISATETLNGFLHKLSGRVGRILGGVLGDWRVSLRVEEPRAKKFKAATLLELEDKEDDESKESRWEIFMDEIEDGTGHVNVISPLPISSPDKIKADKNANRGPQGQPQPLIPSHSSAGIYKKAEELCLPRHSTFPPNPNDEQASQEASSSNIHTGVDSLVKPLLPPVDHDDSEEDIVYVKSCWVTPVPMPSKETKVKEEPQETKVSKQTPPLTSVKKEPGLDASTAAASTADSLPDYGPDMDLQEFSNRFAGGKATEKLLTKLVES
ncbi:hypothetical protein A4X09_0g7710 [Tilletia walkeri]|uniref:Uncharacterized protein n=1 Tax=Tilletia walkeri TaxID=117179 RepID=A0A8X7T0S0_9BASI|nr:hypothetical protein A4X09_0g7710 [Tilletia walkeri]